MSSLNNIKDFVADRLNKSFDDKFKAEVGFAFINELSLFLRRSIDANGMDKTYLASFIVDMQSVTETDDINIEGEYNIWRSINRIPIPIRYKSPIPFVFVGSPDNKISFGYSSSYESPFNKELPYIGNSITYDYINQYLYLRNTTKFDKIRVIAPYANYGLIKDTTTGSNGLVYDHDVELPYPEDLINGVILSLLQGVFGNLDAKDKVVVTDIDNQ